MYFDGIDSFSAVLFKVCIKQVRLLQQKRNGWNKVLKKLFNAEETLKCLLMLTFYHLPRPSCYISLTQILKSGVSELMCHFGLMQFYQSLCYYFHNLEVIFHNSRHKTHKWKKINCLNTIHVTLRSFVLSTKIACSIWHKLTSISSYVKMQFRHYIWN